MQLCDSHCHLDFDAFDHNREQIIQAAQARGVDKIVVPGVQARHFHRLLALREAYPSLVSVAFGLHPCFADQHQQKDLVMLQSMLETELPCALGEIGLDGRPGQPSQTRQLDYFTQQLQLAQHCALPVILHAVKTHEPILRLLKQMNFRQGGIIHAFSGSYEQAKRYHDLGFKLGIGGLITHPHATRLRNLISKVPLDWLVLETDAPDMRLFGQHNAANEPANIATIAAEMAALLNVSAAEIAQQTTHSLQAILSIR